MCVHGFVVYKAYSRRMFLHLLKKNKENRGKALWLSTLLCSGMLQTEAGLNEMKHPELQASCVCEPFQSKSIPSFPGQQVVHKVALVRSSARTGNPDPEKRVDKRQQQLWDSDHSLPSATITHSNMYKDLALGSVWLWKNCCDYPDSLLEKQQWPTAKGRKYFYGFYCFSKEGRIPPFAFLASVAFSSPDF